MSELELKLQLTEAEYATLRAALGTPTIDLQQRNEYYDAADRSWHGQGLAVRLREQDGIGILTVKGGAVGREGWTLRLEEERTLTAAQLERLRGDASELDRAARALLEDKLPPGLGRLCVPAYARLQNRRIGIEFANGRGERVLDRSEYPDGSVHFELELEADSVELAEQAEAELREEFRRLAIGWRPSDVSKLARLRSMLGE